MEPPQVEALQEPVEPESGPRDHSGRPRRPSRTGQWPVVGAVCVGGALGAAARYGASLTWPTVPGAFPWTTLVINVLGCAVIGVFMVVITDLWTAPRLVRPFFGTGVLGGFTTFSTYVVDIRVLVGQHRAGAALAYLALTALSALAAVWLGAAPTRRMIKRRRR
ncbi:MULTISPECIES: fluoride efflux transporter CrcB [Streptomyces]|uniref:Fluoride-specific ion channel FluC n=1 Tax=Streptomyces yunnanensis TaxID=156453 RepID=A0ABY8A0H8_9ACTN|nr:MULTISPECIES: fluoride efflux transporter CrcB [Streptomyces]WEB38164.1 fluoride efflux transporter CrcB [Streptomyces yunnanensis]